MLISSILSGVVLAALAPLQTPTEWFNEDYSGITATDTGWSDDAGKWTRGTGDASALGEGKIEISTGDGELKFAPSSTNTVGSRVVLNAKVTFTPYNITEEFVECPSDAKCALTVFETNGLSFATWVTTRSGSSVKGSWVLLQGVTPVEDQEYQVVTEIDCSCEPTRVRYTVDGVVLTDAVGNSWFSTRNSTKKVASLAFKGSGSVGTITASQAVAEEGRATYAASRPTQMKAGTEISFAITTNENTNVTGTPTYQWYLMDAAGMRSTTALSATSEKYTLDGSEYGHWLVMDARDDNGYLGSGKIWVSELPVVYIEVENGATPTAAKETHNANFFITSGKNDSKGKAVYNNDAEGTYPSEIHVRGNSTAGQVKKPWKIKLNKKTDLFGLGGGVKSKHWVLLANFFDESLMRNKVLYDLSEHFGAPVWIKNEWVDVVLNGEFQGNYLLCQHIRVEEDRINIYDWGSASEKIAECALEANPAIGEDGQAAIEDLLETNCMWMTTGKFTYLGTNYTVVTKGTAGVVDSEVTVVWKKFSTDISGGYIFEIDAKKVTGGGNPAPSHIKAMTVNGGKGNMVLNIALNTPEYVFTNPAISNEVWNMWWNLGTAYTTGTGFDTNTGKHYMELADFDAMVAYWLSQYVAANNDAAAYSRYSYIDQGGKMVFGPLWDCDYCAASLQIRERNGNVTNEFGAVTYPDIEELPESADASPYKWIPRNGSDNFIGFWSADPYFAMKVREKYLEARSYLEDIVKDGGLIDQYKEYLTTSARANDLLWNNRIGFFGNANEEGDVAVFKRFMKLRLEWLDAKFTNIGTAISEMQSTVPHSALRFTRTTTLTATVADATPVSESLETNISDVEKEVKGDGVQVSVSAPMASANNILAYVNGEPIGELAVSGGTANFSLRRSQLKEGQNLFTFIERDADNKILTRNVSLLTSIPSGKGFRLIIK